MTIAIIGTVGVPARYGGFETLVDNLLDNSSTDMVIYCSGPAYPDKVTADKGARLHYLPLHANGIQSVPYDVLSIIHGLVKGYRDFLVLGVSGSAALPLVKLFFRKTRVITNIDGLEWRRDKWGRFAKWFLKFSEKMAVRHSDVVICDNEAIADYVAKEYGKACEVIPYGGDQHNLTGLTHKAGDYALALCRIEPENNVHLILEAFSKTNKPLKFIGNWDNSDYGMNLRSKYSGFSNLDLIDPIYDPRALVEYRSGCEFYVHGHSAGGTNPALVEMMHYEKPIAAFDCVYNRATMENKGSFFKDADDLRALIEVPFAPGNGPAMGEIARRRYTWDKVREQYFSLFA